MHFSVIIRRYLATFGDRATVPHSPKVDIPAGSRQKWSIIVNILPELGALHYFWTVKNPYLAPLNLGTSENIDRKVSRKCAFRPLFDDYSPISGQFPDPSLDTQPPKLPGTSERCQNRPLTTFTDL